MSAICLGVDPRPTALDGGGEALFGETEDVSRFGLWRRKTISECTGTSQGT